MPADPATLTEALKDRNLWPVLLSWSQRYFVDDQVGFVLDVLQRKPIKRLYTEYIARGAPKEINIAEADLREMRDLAQLPNDEGFKRMGKEMKNAFDEMVNFLSPTYSTGGQAFLQSEAYQAYKLRTSSNPAVTTAIASLKLSTAKAKQVEPLLTLYLKARTPEDAWQAYAAMVKLAGKSKLDPALTKAGKPAAAVERDVKVLKLVETLKTDMAEAKRFLETAIKNVKAKGLPAKSEVSRMFESGRMRTDKVTKGYTAAVKLDRTFATKFAALAADKKKVDTQWAAYRKMLGK